MPCGDKQNFTQYEYEYKYEYEYEYKIFTALISHKTSGYKEVHQ